MAAIINNNNNINRNTSNAIILEAEDQQLLPSWDKVVAIAFVYKRLFFSLAIIPGVMVLTPILWWLVFPICDVLTNNYTLLTFMLTYASTRSIQNKIRNTAPSPKEAKEALLATEFWLPLIMFVVLATIANYNIWFSVGELLGINGILTFSPVLPISFAFQMAVGTILLGLAVVLRYIGPVSIVRCSSSPLLANPMKIRITKLLSDWDSVDGVYNFAVLDHYREDARRLQCPTFFDAIMQVVISGILTLAFTCVSVLPYSSSSSSTTEDMNNGSGGDDNNYDNHSNKNLSLIFFCILSAVLANLYRTALDGSSHELNPIRYHASQWKNHHIIIMKIKSICKSMFYSGATVPLIAYVAPWILPSYFGKVGIDDMWPVLLSCALPAMLVTLYLDIFDDVLRTQLCTPTTNIQKAVEEATDDNRVGIFLDVIMHSILHSQSGIVEKLVQSVPPLLNNLERKEIERNEEAMEAMAKVLLDKSSTSGDDGIARLEEDILRLWVLESLGGPSSSDENIRSWIQPQHNELNTGRTLVEPLSVPLVRALCAYVGGLGEALVICGGQKVPPNAYPWNIPPGAVVCAEYSLRGAARCILFNLSHSPQILSDWRSTHLSMMIPVLIVSAYRLQQGIVKFTQARNGINEITAADQFDFVRRESPELLSLFTLCNDSVADILQKLLSLDGVSRIDFDLKDPVIRKWMEGILAKSKSM